MLSDEGLNAIFDSPNGVEPPKGIISPSLISLTALNISENNLTEGCTKLLGAFLKLARCSRVVHRAGSSVQQANIAQPCLLCPRPSGPSDSLAFSELSPSHAHPLR